MKDSAATSGGRGDGTIPRPAWRFSGRRGTPVHKRDSAPATLPPEIRETLAALASERAATVTAAAAAGPDTATATSAHGATRLDLGSAAASRTTPPVAGAALPVERRSRGDRSATVATSSAQSFPPPAPLPQAFDPSVILEPVSELQGQVAEIREQLASLRQADGAPSPAVGGLEPAPTAAGTPGEARDEDAGPLPADVPDAGPVPVGAEAEAGPAGITSELAETDAEQPPVAAASAEPGPTAPEGPGAAAAPAPPSRHVALTAAERRRRAKARAKERALAEQEASQLRRRLFARGREVDQDVAIEPTQPAAGAPAPAEAAEASVEPAPTAPATPVATVESDAPDATTTSQTVVADEPAEVPAAVAIRDAVDDPAGAAVDLKPIIVAAPIAGSAAAEDDTLVAASPPSDVDPAPAPVSESAVEEPAPQVASQDDAVTQEPPVEASPVWEAAPWSGPEPREGIDRAADAAWGLGKVPILASVAHGVPSVEDVPLGPPSDGSSESIPDPSSETHDAQEPDMTPPVPPLEWEPVIAPIVGSAVTRHPAGATTPVAAHGDPEQATVPRPTEPGAAAAAAAGEDAAEFVHMRPMAWDPHAEAPPIAPAEEPQPELPAAIVRLAGPLFVPAEPVDASRAVTRETPDRNAAEAARARIARRRSDLDVLVTSLAAPTAPQPD